MNKRNDNQLFSKVTNKLLEDNIISVFGFKVQLIRTPQNTNKLYFGFIPHGTLSNLNSDEFPDEDKKKLVEVYNIFADYYIEALNVQSIFRSRYNDVCKQDCRNFETVMETVIVTYEDDNNVKLLDLFKASLGMIDYGILPRYLQNKIFDDVK